MLKVIINRLLENKNRDAKTRDNIYGDITRGEISAPDGLLSLLGSDRNASYQRVGFLTGYATAIGLESDILTTVQASFARRQNNVPYLGRVPGISGDNGYARDDTGMTGASGASKEVGSNSVNERGDNLEANGSEDVNVSATTDGDGDGLSGGVGVVDITEV
ncbi:hypothetical protein ST47_g5915 [Ascochyta rabiei]|uniref:Uncharacterized protein n=2 Tax=Didymella rabiei TaxID=5454 RepID=A0A163D516_DIDRA|nr:hypothetical protein ST47_g5915 [Ascochyta rabiei]